jgi:hypothetical protein
VGLKQRNETRRWGNEWQHRGEQERENATQNGWNSPGSTIVQPHLLPSSRIVQAFLTYPFKTGLRTPKHQFHLHSFPLLILPTSNRNTRFSSQRATRNNLNWTSGNTLVISISEPPSWRLMFQSHPQHRGPSAGGARTRGGREPLPSWVLNSQDYKQLG